MTNQNNAAQAANDNPLSDEYVNAVIQRHGYDSPESVIAQLHQWIGLHGGENTVTLLMYEAHKALSKLRAPVADERQGDIAAALQDSAYCAGLQRGFVLGNHDDNDGLCRALESRDGYVKTIKDARAALASAPVAGEAQPVAWMTEDGSDAWTDAKKKQAMQHAGKPGARLAASYSVPLTYAAPQASAEPARPCSCPSGDGSLRHPCPAHPQTNKGRA